MKTIFLVFSTVLAAFNLILADDPTPAPAPAKCPMMCPFIMPPVCANSTLDGKLYDFDNNCTLASANQCPTQTQIQRSDIKVPVNQFVFYKNGKCYPKPSQVQTKPAPIRDQQIQPTDPTICIYPAPVDTAK